jgi:hypothetical protein
MSKRATSDPLLGALVDIYNSSSDQGVAIAITLTAPAD